MSRKKYFDDGTREKYECEECRRVFKNWMDFESHLGDCWLPQENL